MSDIDLDKVVLASPYNSFKNDDAIYTGSISFPTSVSASEQWSTTVDTTLAAAPTFSNFFANFLELLDATNSGSAQWYPISVSAFGNVGVQVTAPSAQAGWTGGYIYPIINGTTLSVKAVWPNPYSVDVTLAPLTVDFAFVVYSLVA